MPIKRAAHKAIRSDRKKREKNVRTVSNIRTLTKKVQRLLASKDEGSIRAAMRNLTSAMDKAVQKGIMHRNTASRAISRISVKIKKALK